MKRKFDDWDVLLFVFVGVPLIFGLAALFEYLTGVALGPLLFLLLGAWILVPDELRLIVIVAILIIAFFL